MCLLLVVEDDDDVRSGLADLLRDAGYDVQTAANGFEGMALVTSAKQTVDLVLLDLMMPGMSGFEMLEQMRRSSITTPVVLQTGLRAFNAGAYPMLHKPVELSSLMKLVSQYAEPCKPTQHRAPMRARHAKPRKRRVLMAAG